MPRSERISVHRFDQIDAARGCGILLVILLHARQRFSQVLPAEFLPHWPYLIARALNHYGLTTFFAISGFLITGISIRRFGSLAGMRPGAFYRMRFARIAPFLVLLVLVLSVLHVAHVRDFTIDPHVSGLKRVLLAVFTFHLNWLEARRGTLPLAWEVLWSLSVEEMFYLVFPLLCVFFCRILRKPWTFTAVLWLFVFIGPVARTLADPQSSWAHKGYLSCSDAIAMGCLTALALESARRRDLPHTLLLPMQIAGAAIMLFFAFCPASISLGYLDRFGLSATVLALGVSMFAFASTLRNRVGTVWSAPLRFLGRYIYEAYLVHALVVIGVAAVCTRFVHRPITLWYVAIVVVTAGVAWVCGHFYSEPLNKLLRTRRQQPVPREDKSAPAEPAAIAAT